MGNVADLKEVLCQGSQNPFFRSALIQRCVSTGGQDSAGSCSNQASHAGSGYSFYKPRADLCKTLKAWEISLIAEGMIKWNQPPFKRLMSSLSPKKRPRSPLWKPRVTSPPDPGTSPFLCCSQVRGFLPLQMSLFHSQSSLTLLFCRIPLPSERGPLGGVIRRGEGFVQLAGRPYSHGSQKSSLFPSATQMQVPEARPNSAPRQCRQRWKLHTV